MRRSGATSNADELSQLFERLMGTFDMTQPGSGADTLGKDLVATTAMGILGRTINDQLDPDQEQLAANQGDYLKRKEKAGKPVGIGLAADSPERMLSLPQVVGEVEVEPDRVRMTYGKTEAAKRKAQWFTAGSNASLGMEPSGAQGQPERPFYALDEFIEGELVHQLSEHVERYLEGL